MSNGPSNSREKRIANDTQLIGGIQKHQNELPASIKLFGQDVTPAQMVTTLQTRIGTARAIDPARAALTAAVQADRLERSQTNPIVADFKSWLVLTHGNDPQMLGDFGVAPRKKGTKKPATKVVAAAKAKATRAARGTIGPKKKAAIKGTLTGPVVVGPSPEQTAQPAVAPQPIAKALPANTGTGASPEGPANGSHS